MFLDQKWVEKPRKTFLTQKAIHPDFSIDRNNHNANISQFLPLKFYVVYKCNNQESKDMMCYLYNNMNFLFTDSVSQNISSLFHKIVVLNKTLKGEIRTEFNLLIHISRCEVVLEMEPK